MRLTETMRYENVLRDITTAQQRMYRAQEQVSSGKKVTKPSDDPVAAGDILRIRSEQSENAQYSRNLSFVTGKLQFTDNALGSMHDLVHRAVEVAASSLGSMDTPNPDPADTYVQEINGIRDELLGGANSQYGGRYIFGGSAITQPPYVKDPISGVVTFNGNSDPMALDVNRGVPLNTQVSGFEALRFTETVTDQNGQPQQVEVELFDQMAKLMSAIQSGQKPQIDEAMRKLDAITEKIDIARAKIGNYETRATSVESDLVAAKLARSSELTEKEAVDLAAAITELTASQQNLEATLAVGANISKISILDYLK